MSREKGKTKVHVPTTTLLPTPPPRRFLGASSYLSLPKKLAPPPSVSAPPTLSDVSAGPRQQTTTPQCVTPPKLTRFPTIVLTPVDVSKLSVGKEGAICPPITTTVSSNQALPPPPPLTKMPISTRKDRRINSPSKTPRNDAEASADDSEKQQEPPRKRSRVAQKSGESSRGESTTPRKIIQEIFGPDKSKRPKGKGRKKRRGVTTPKKKILTGEVAASTAEKEEQESEEKYEAEEDKGDVEESEELSQHEVSEEIDTGELALEDGSKVETNEEEEEEEKEKQVENADEKGQHQTGDNDDQSEEEVQEDQIQQNIENLEDIQDETASVSSSASRRVSKRQAKAVANERLKRLSQSEDGVEKEDASELNQVEDEDESEVVTKEETVAAGVHSRRSTAEDSSKSGSSIAQPDSESSGGDGASCINNSNNLERQRFNPTPYSNISEDEDDEDVIKDEEGADNDSIGDDIHQEHKDSDVDSTYSWKPVRAAAAVALEQVTKNQGNGSTGLPGDAEAKAAAAAERRARKINRYKGRNRRTLMFKSSSSKKHTSAHNSRYSAQPTIAPKVFHHGHYFQAGDIVSVEMADGSSVHGQIRGLLMDHFGNLSAGIRFLAPKHPVYAYMDFEAINYAFRYDIPEKLIKIEFVNFVMHLNLDYFDGNPSFSKIEKKSLYTRMGKSLQKSYETNESDPGSDSASESSSSSSTGSEHDKKKAKDEGNQQGRRRHISDSSTDVEQELNNDKEKSKEPQDILGVAVDEAEDQAKDDDPAENATDSVTRIEVDV